MAKTSKLFADVVGWLKPIMDFDAIEPSATYTIGQLSSHLRVSLRTLRFYEQSGLLAPSREGLRRLYSQDDLERLEVIVTLRELEASLTSIKSLMTAIDGDERLPERELKERTDVVLRELGDENRSRIAELERINSRIAEARRKLQDA
jgi:DNA-binding transcriptional MerR regulator